MPVITQFSVYSHCNDLGGKVWNPAIRWAHKHAVFVELETENGVTGLGECWCFDTAPDALIAFLRTEVAPHILGIDVDDQNAVFQHLLSRATLTARHGFLASALSGVDIALWDIKSRAADMPLWQYLSCSNDQATNSGGQIYLYASGGLYAKDKTNDDLLTEMQSLHEQGFNTVKMKIGALAINEDIDRVKTVIAGLPESCQLIIDGVYSYSTSDAKQFYESLSNKRIAAFQSPVKAKDILGMQSLTESGVPVMATEAEYREEIHQVLIDTNAVTYLQTAPIACGGISRLIQLSKAIENKEIALSLEVSSTAVALLAACHFAASHKVAHTEYHFIHQVFFDELELSKVAGRTGWFQLSSSPGIGISLPYDKTNLAFRLRQN